MAKLRTIASRHYGLLQVVVVVAGIEAYELLRQTLTPNWALAERHARDVLSLERMVHIEWEEELQRTFLRAPDLVRVMNIFYFVGHFVVTAAFFVWLYRANPGVFRRFRNGFLTATFLAFVVHWGFPTAPPRLAGVGLEDTLRQLSHIDIGSRTSASFTDPVAAVPSLHAGFAAGVGAGLLVYARSLPWKAIGALYPLAVMLTIIVTGNHFVFDALAGVAVMGLGFWLSEGLSRRRGGGTLRPASRGGAVR